MLANNSNGNNGIGKHKTTNGKNHSGSSQVRCLFVYHCLTEGSDNDFVNSCCVFCHFLFYLEWSISIYEIQNVFFAALLGIFLSEYIVYFLWLFFVELKDNQMHISPFTLFFSTCQKCIKVLCIHPSFPIHSNTYVALKHLLCFRMYFSSF